MFISSFFSSFLIPLNNLAHFSIKLKKFLAPQRFSSSIHFPVHPRIQFPDTTFARKWYLKKEREKERKKERKRRECRRCSRPRLFLNICSLLRISTFCRFVFANEMDLRSQIPLLPIGEGIRAIFKF